MAEHELYQFPGGEWDCGLAISHAVNGRSPCPLVRAPDAELAVRRWGIVEKSLSYGGMKADATDLRNGAEELRERNCHSAAAILDAIADALEEETHVQDS